MATANKILGQVKATFGIRSSVGDGYQVFIKNNGELWGCGRNAKSQLGDDTTIDRSSPVQVYGGGTNWKNIYTGYKVTAAIKSDDTLWMWGDNAWAQCAANRSIGSFSQPAQVSGSWNMVNTEGDLFVAGIKTDRTLWAWGYNTIGQFGYGVPEASFYSTPVQIFDNSFRWRMVSCGHWSIAAIDENDFLYVCGANVSGQLGDGTIVSKSSPVMIGEGWKSVACGPYHTIALKSDNTLWAWGFNGGGQLGDGTTVDRSSPVQINIPNTIHGVEDGLLLKMGGTCSYAITSDGKYYAWGSDSDGQFGLVPPESFSTPTQIFDTTEKKWISISAWGTILTRIKPNGGIYFTGDGQYGASGKGDETSYPSPVQVGDAADWVGEYITLYTVPGATQANVTIFAANQGMNDMIRIAISSAGAVLADSHFIEYDTFIAANDTLKFTGIALAATDVVRVYSVLGVTSFTATGIEIT